MINNPPIASFYDNHAFCHRFTSFTLIKIIAVASNRSFNQSAMKKHLGTLTIFSTILLLSLSSLLTVTAQDNNDAPLRLAVAGLKHGHAPFIFARKGKTDVNVVGIYEPDTELAGRYAVKYSLDKQLFYTDLAKMLDAVKPEALAAYGSIFDHLAAVEACAPRGIHVMVEKPLATNLTQAKRMEQLASQHRIYLLTNYETSWYPSVAKTLQLVNDSNFIGHKRKVVVHDGHEGPKEIGVGKEFLDWLTDPVQNGGGAVVDFGCYGANLMTCLMGDEKPVSVTAVLRNFKPDVYTKVDDEATIIVSYPTAQCIIQASWNWPFSRKDMEVYGDSGYIIAVNNQSMRTKNRQTKNEQNITVTSKEVAVYEDPFSYFRDVVRGKISIPKNGLYSLENNVMVVRILEAAKESAKKGQTVMIKY
ncbi:MAG: Gfo/Idh/MocA family oxidoreductase [Ferruginibacter sp.]|nr:Gfo/Idh/MocA family oxidoreductase [Ferruginibacter sp.]